MFGTTLDVVVVSVMVLLVLSSTIFCCFSQRYPISARSIPLTMTIAVICFGLLLNFILFPRQGWPCAAHWTFTYLGALALTWCYFLRVWVLWFRFGISSDLKAVNGESYGWFLKHRYLISRPFMLTAILLFVLFIAVVLGIFAALVPEMRVAQKCPKLMKPLMTTVAAILALISVAILAFIFRIRDAGVDGLFHKKELALIGVPATLIFVAWLGVLIFDPNTFREYQLGHKLQIVAVVLVILASLVYPTCLCFTTARDLNISDADRPSLGSRALYLLLFSERGFGSGGARRSSESRPSGSPFVGPPNIGGAGRPPTAAVGVPVIPTLPHIFYMEVR